MKPISTVNKLGTAVLVMVILAFVLALRNKSPATDDSAPPKASTVSDRPDRPASPLNSAQSVHEELQRLYEGHRWFDLRDEVAFQGTTGFYRVSVEAAFNEPKAETDLRKILSSTKLPARFASLARCELRFLYGRLGRFRDAAGVVKRPDDDFCADPKGLPRTGNQIDSVAKSAHSRPIEIPVQIVMGRPHVPVTINGVKANYLLDTGTAYCVVSPSEAKRLNLSAGIPVGEGIREALATVDIGDVHLKNVAFWVIDMFRDLPPDMQGIIGAPVILKFGRFRWKPKERSLTLLEPSRIWPSATSNLAFDESFTFNRASSLGHPVTLFLDTGIQITHLYSSFPLPADYESNEIPCRFQVCTFPVSGPERTEEIPSYQLRFILLIIGGTSVSLRPAWVFKANPTSEGDEFYNLSDGSLGLDLLGQADAVEIDYNAMTLKLAINE